MKQSLIDGILEYRDKIETVRKRGLKEDVYIYDHIDFDIRYKMRFEESKELDEAVDYFAEKQIYEFMDMFNDYRYGNNGEFRKSSNRWEGSFPNMLSYLEEKSTYKVFVEYLSSCYRSNYFDIKFLVDNFDNVKKYADKSIVCAQRMYELGDEKYLEFARTLALRKLLARIIVHCDGMAKESDGGQLLADRIYEIVKKHIPFERVLILDENGLGVKGEYGSMDDIYKSIRSQMKRMKRNYHYGYGLHERDYGTDFTSDCPNVNYINDDVIDMINRVGIETGIFKDAKIEKNSENMYVMVESKTTAKDYMNMKEEELLLEVVFNFNYFRRGHSADRRNHLAGLMFEMAKERRLGEVFEKLKPVCKILEEYAPRNVNSYCSRYPLISKTIECFDFERQKISLPESNETRDIYQLFMIMDSSLENGEKTNEIDDIIIHYMEEIQNIVRFSYSHESLYKWIVENHMEKLYSFIQEGEDYSVERMLKLLRKDEKRVGYLLASKGKKFKKYVREAIYGLDNPMKALEIEPIDKAHKKAIDEVVKEYKILVGDDIESTINDMAKKEIKAAALKKYSWIDMDSLALEFGETRLSKEACAYFFKIIENGIIEELPLAYDKILSRISSQKPLEDYTNLIESYKDKGFKPNNRFILYFCKSLLDENTLYRLIEDTKDEKITKSIALTYLDVYKFKSTGSELELLIDLAAKSKNKDIIKHAKKQIRNARRVMNMGALDFKRIELSTNSFMKNDKLEFEHSSGRLEARVGKKNKLDLLLDGEAIKRLPAGKTEMDKVAKDRINLLKKEIKKVEEKYASYLKNLFNFNVKLTADELKEIISYPVADKFIHSIFLKSKGVVFTIDESNDFVDVNYDEVQLDGKDIVEFVSNLELSQDDLDEIREYMSDNKLEDLIGQFSLRELELKDEYDLKEKEINFISVNNKLEDMGFILGEETFELEMQDGVEINMNAYLGSVSDTYNMTLNNVYIRPGIKEIENTAGVKRVLNGMMDAGINIQ